MLSRIALIVTTRCDYRCAHCLRGLSGEKVDFPLELLPGLLEQARPFGARHVALTGGEPRLHPRFAELVEMICAAGYTWHFVSNGAQVEPYLRLMERFREGFTGVSLSLDGATAEVHDAIRHKQGAFERVIAAVKRYQQAGFQVQLGACLSQLNKGQVEDLLHLAEELGVCGLKFGGTIPAPGNQALVLSEADLLGLYQQIQALREVTELPLSTFSSLYTPGGVHFCGNLELKEATFNPRGEMMFCCDTRGYGAALGSLRDGSFAGLIQEWLRAAAALQGERVRCIAEGVMGEGFDSCVFCNEYFTNRM